jgi:4-hydroxybenzoate polyprenyltransferase
LGEKESIIVHTQKQQDLIPLVVDVDYTLLRTDLFAEGLVHILRDQPHQLPHLLGVFLTQGIVGVKEAAWKLSHQHFTEPPFNTCVTALMAQANQEGRKIILCSAGCQDAIKAVGDSLGFPVECAGSENGRNLKSSRKADFLVSRFGEKGFDYIGDSKADLPVWKSARKAISTRQISCDTREIEILPHTSARRSIFRGFRFHQWAKNLLVFLPAIAGHAVFSPEVLLPTLIAFFSLGLIASGTYFLNDIFDIAADRTHPTKADRPVPSGSLILHSAIFLSGILIISGLALAALLPALATALIGLYLLSTITYSIKLKTLPIIDLAALTSFYLLRVYIGGAAAAIMPSVWLATFCIFVFFSLACAKRATEFHASLTGDTGKTRRSYTTQDYPFFLSSGICAGLLSSVVIGLYLQGDMVHTLYARPDILILGVPIVALWFTRLWFLVHRGRMHGDPVAFALQDPLTWALGAIALLLLYVATA